jgi:cysteine desulfurase / selenocysteine lyase
MGQHAGTRGLDIERIRKDFPLLTKRISGKPVIYFDSAATGQKPMVVMERLQQFYSSEYAKPQEKHKLSKNVTSELDDARSKIADFFGARDKEIVFTRGCTEAINLVAGGFARGLLKSGDDVLVTALEHHANIVPWQMACEQSGARLRVIPITSSGEPDMRAYEKMLTRRTKIVAVAHTSHVLGTILPVKEMAKLAHKKNIPLLVDGAQAAPHMPVDFKELDCDFYTLSGHKMGSPTGIGILYGKKKWLDKLPPSEGGADMSKKVSFEKTEFNPPPAKFEAGTPPFAEIIAFGELISYLEKLDMEKTSEYEKDLLDYATEKLSAIDQVVIHGTAPEKEPVISFQLLKKDVKKLEKYLSDKHNIFGRAGDLSAQPLMETLGVKNLYRVSFCYYNTYNEIDKFIRALNEFIRG